MPALVQSSGVPLVLLVRELCFGFGAFSYSTPLRSLQHLPKLSRAALPKLHQRFLYKFLTLDFAVT